MKRFLVPAFLAWLLLLPARVEAQDDQYLTIYSLIQEADALKAAEQPTALSRYLEAQSSLQRFQRVYPEWNSKVVAYRLSYLSARIAELSSKSPAGASVPAPAAGGTTSGPARSAPPAAELSNLESQLAAVQNQVRQLETDKTVLESKLKEALSAQPAAIDPRELARVQDQVRSLQKENDLLKVSVDRQQARASSVDPKLLEQLKRELADANHKLAGQTEQTTSLELEKKALQNKLSSLIPATWNQTNITETTNALAEVNRQLIEQNQVNAGLARDKESLQARVRELTVDAEAAAALRAENEILKRQLTELKNINPGASGDTARQLAEARAQLATLQSEKDVLRLEKSALENRLKEVSGSSAVPAAASAAEAARIKQLESERNDLQKKLEVAQKDLGTAQKEIGSRNSKAAATRVEDLAGQLEILRTRLAVLEAQQVPYTTEELALFNKSETIPDPRAGKKSIRELPAGAVALESEAQRDFAAKRYDQAQEKYMQVLRQDEKNVYTLANLAVIQLEMNHLDEAEKNLNQALALAPDDAYSLSMLGYLRFRQEKYDESLDVLGRAAKLDPQNPEIQNYLGLTLSQKGMRVAAETALRRAVELDPNYSKAHYNLAVIYITQRPPATEMARLHYKKAIAGGVARNEDLEKLLGQAGAADTH